MDLPRALVSSGAFLAVVTAARLSAGANICNETVPSNRMVDGIPAYDQCSDTTSSTIYSNNGVDTSTTSNGTDWVRTQGSGGYQCTELAHRYLYFKWSVKSVPNGNAGTWCDGTIPSGLVKASSPMHGDLIVFAPGSCGADATTGHVAVVDVVNADSTVTLVEQNRAGRRKCALSTAACFLHASANDGTSVDAGMPQDAAVSTGEDAASSADAVRRADGRPAFETSPSLGTGGGSGNGNGGASASDARMGAGGNVGAGGAIAGATGAGGKASNGSGGNTATTDTSSTASGAGGMVSSSTADSPSDGCSCRVASRGRALSGIGSMLSVLAFALARRRRR